MNNVYDYGDDPLFETKIENATGGLKPACKKILKKVSKINAIIITDYITSMQTEMNPSDAYKKAIIVLLCKFSQINKDKVFQQMTRQDVVAFLERLRKSEAADPLHKWIGTYNLYGIYLQRFFKWLYHPDVEPNKRTKPSVVENIPQLKRREQSIYKPSDLWSQEDDLLFLKYCPSKRMKCYHAMSRDTGCRPHELLRLRIRDIIFKYAGDKQYAEVLLTGKTGSRHIPLIDSLPYIKDYLDHEHPQPTNFMHRYLLEKGEVLEDRSVLSLFSQSTITIKRCYFPNYLNSVNVPPADKQRIRDLLGKPWNPYIRRHSALTDKSLFLKEHVLRQHAGWSPRSQMHLKYLHYFGNESSESILEAYGIITKDQKGSTIMRSKQCPNCNEPNKPDSKFCANCRMVLTYDAYGDTLESEKQKQDRLTLVEERLSSTQLMLQQLIASLEKITDQKQLNVLAQSMFSSGILKAGSSLQP